MARTMPSARLQPTAPPRRAGCATASTAALRFVPLERMDAEGYGYLKPLVEQQEASRMPALR